MEAESLGVRGSLETAGREGTKDKRRSCHLGVITSQEEGARSPAVDTGKALVIFLQDSNMDREVPGREPGDLEISLV